MIILVLLVWFSLVRYLGGGSLYEVTDKMSVSAHTESSFMPIRRGRIILLQGLLTGWPRRIGRGGQTVANICARARRARGARRGAAGDLAVRLLRDLDLETTATARPPSRRRDQTTPTAPVANYNHCNGHYWCLLRSDHTTCLDWLTEILLGHRVATSL